MVTTAAIVLHNLPEGILTLFTSYASPTLGATLTLAIALRRRSGRKDVDIQRPEQRVLIG